MAHFNDLEAMLYRSALLFVGVNTVMKVGLRKFNGFDALAVLLLTSAVSQPFVRHFGYIVEIALSGIVVALMALCAGSPRKATLFLSSIIVFTDALTWSEQIIGDMEDVDRCTPVNTAAAMQCAILVLLIYAVHATEEERYKPDGGDQETQLKTWTIVVVGACAARSAAMSYDCVEAKQSVSQIANMFKTVLLVSACVANGEDESAGYSEN